jgi:hypothetical protein
MMPWGSGFSAMQDGHHGAVGAGRNFSISSGCLDDADGS